MIPLEMITAGASFILSAGFRIWAANSEAKAAMFKRAMTAHKAEVQERTSIREVAGWFGITRRIIALSVVAAVVVFPIIAPALFPFIPVNYCGQDSSTTSVLFGLFSSDVTSLACTSSTAIQIQPFHTHLVAAISAFYFGGKVVR